MNGPGHNPSANSSAPVDNFKSLITEEEYCAIRTFLYQRTGIELGPFKQALVTARLGKRLTHFGMRSYNDLLTYAKSNEGTNEQQIIVDLLTTNESYFFREKHHFDFLKSQLSKDNRNRELFRVWSAASSTGEEAYSLAMELSEHCRHRPWEILGSDISTRVLNQAQQGLYLQLRTEGIPLTYLKKYCLRGTGEYEGTLLIDSALRKKVSFQQINLMKPIPDIGKFDAIFLRNVLIYFDTKTKQDTIQRIYPLLAEGGYLFIGHSESIKGYNPNLHYVAPATYQKSTS